MDGIPYTAAVEIARREGVIVVNLYDERRMTNAVRRAVKKGLLKRAGGKQSAAQFKPVEQSQ